jgi:predicted DNA-binding ribbon-helix-helix protein
MQRDTTQPHLPLSAGAASAVKSVSTLVNRNVTVGGHRTSICRREGKALNELVTEIHRHRAESSLTAAIRVYLLRYFSAAATDEGHRLAGHGLPIGSQLPV